MTESSWGKGDYFEEVVPIDQEDDYHVGSSYSELASRHVDNSDEPASTLKDVSLRKGKWTTEEENYANKIINLFNRGILPIPAGTTLRSYLSEKLHCDPMRITKKFAGASCIGKQIFQPTVSSPEVDHFEELEDLQRLEKSFRTRIGGGGSNSCFTDSTEEDKSNSSPATETGRYASPAFGRSPGDRTVKWDSEIGEERKAPSAYGLRRSSLTRVKSSFKRIASAPDLTRPGRFEMEFPRKRIVPTDESEEPIGQSHSYSRGSHDRSSQEMSIAQKAGSEVDSRQRKPRSQSMMDLNDFEKYISDDTAAGDLLMQFHFSAVDEKFPEISPVASEPLKKRQFIHSGPFGGANHPLMPPVTGSAAVPPFSVFGLSSSPFFQMPIPSSAFFGMPPPAPPAPPAPAAAPPAAPPAPPAPPASAASAAIGGAVAPGAAAVSTGTGPGTTTIVKSESGIAFSGAAGAPIPSGTGIGTGSAATASPWSTVPPHTIPNNMTSEEA